MTEQRLRGALLAVAAAILVGTALELLLLEHWGSPPQLVPLALCCVGLLALAAVALRPGRSTVLGARWVLGVCVPGAVFGLWEHLEHNAEFATEIDASIGGSELALAALTGANPLLAPGIFTVAALAGLAATWDHPALRTSG